MNNKSLRAGSVGAPWDQNFELSLLATLSRFVEQRLRSLVHFDLAINCIERACQIGGAAFRFVLRQELPIPIERPSFALIARCQESEG